MPFEAFGMKVDLELVVKNAKQVQKQVAESMKDIPGGISKGIMGGGGGGVGGFIGKATVAMGALLVIGEGVKKIVNVLKESSPYLKGIFNVFGRAMTMFFRPFGDFLASLLKPLALILMKAAVNWLKFWRGDPAKVIKEAEPRGLIPTIGKIERIREGLPDKIGQEILDNIIAGSQTFVELPKQMKDSFFGWLLENSDQIKLIPKDVRNNILTWIGENKEALSVMTKEVAAAFRSDLLSPEGEELLKGVAPSFADKLRMALEDPSNVAGIKLVLSDFKDHLKGWLDLNLPEGGGGVRDFKFGIEDPSGLPAFMFPENILPRTGKGVD